MQDQEKIIRDKFGSVQSILKKIQNFSVPCQFDRVQSNQTTLLLTGLSGSGKSRTGTQIIKAYCQESILSFNEEFDNFKSKKCQNFDKKEVNYIKKAYLQVIDSPGFEDDQENEFENENFEISEKIAKFVSENLFCSEEGLSGIIYCVMVGNCWKICQSQVRGLFWVLMLFCYCYKGFDFGNCPRISVLFNNVGFDEAYDNQEQNLDQNQNQNQKQNLNNENQNRLNNSKIKRLIDNFKDLLGQVIKDMQDTLDGKFNQQWRQQILNLINKILPEENFYCYKYYKKNSLYYSKDKIEKEMKVLTQLIKDNQQYGSFVIKRQSEIQILPVYMRQDSRYLFIQMVQGALNNSRQKIQQIQQIFSKNQLNNDRDKMHQDNIIQYVDYLEKIQQNFDRILSQQPLGFLKISGEIFHEFDQQLLDLIHIMGKYCTSTIDIFDIQQGNTQRGIFQQMSNSGNQGKG
ncbi:P-loop containing nucleoside triphosphate hydrolase [Pseudocohnilembus persalinus]|uniref:p-loop containing nucleoside triphosphate hydrolase n=1 Tax=Pseudocohnilembus persalinus TaxID=266149 RepID=A0A0V0QEH1_PSEPJ|nr:P-loop containing nucleoside triphosphate hydrolase [Pseudocohnilembus persalinus]|eukprot:KRX00563.1 P-loop containing nucleoside triphosphate hydrolase [Pseudocohnilembus persalinus]